MLLIFDRSGIKVLTIKNYFYFRLHYYRLGDPMRRFNWRKFRRKGTRKLSSKDEKLLESKVTEIKNVRTGSIKEIAREVLPEE